VIFSALLTIDDDASYYRNVVRKRMRRRGEVVETDVPGVFFLEIGVDATTSLSSREI